MAVADKLTEPAVKNAKEKEKAFKLADGAGLYLEVMPNGSKYWRLKYRFGSKEKADNCINQAVAASSDLYFVLKTSCSSHSLPY